MIPAEPQTKAQPKMPVRLMAGPGGMLTGKKLKRRKRTPRKKAETITRLEEVATEELREEIRKLLLNLRRAPGGAQEGGDCSRGHPCEEGDRGMRATSRSRPQEVSFAVAKEVSAEKAVTATTIGTAAKEVFESFNLFPVLLLRATTLQIFRWFLV